MSHVEVALKRLERLGVVFVRGDALFQLARESLNLTTTP
jgi:hypothetical protein